MLVFMMGIIFELPLVSALLSKIGLLNRSFFKQYRKHAIVVLLIVAAVITPSSDPFTLMAVFLPIYILWEFSAILVKPAPKKRRLTSFTFQSTKIQEKVKKQGQFGLY